MALVGMAAILTLTLLMINVGRLLIERERTRMRTDVSVMSGATIYARCLNIYALLKKIDKTAKETSDTLGKVPYIGPVVTAAYEAIHAAKITFQESSPYLALGGIELMAEKNGLIAVPYWNVKDFFDMGSNLQGMIPSLNFDVDEKNSKNAQINSGSDTDAYSYRQRSNNQKIGVETDRVRQDSFGGASGNYRDKKTGRFVHRDQDQSAESEGEHSLTLLTYSATKTPGFKSLPGLISLARARIAGGDFDTDSSNSLKWGCFLAPVTVKNQKDFIPKAETSVTGIASIGPDELLASIQQWIHRIPAVLH
jgi:hypothetical protein